MRAAAHMGIAIVVSLERPVSEGAHGDGEGREGRD